jgi:hypothetical protein
MVSKGKLKAALDEYKAVDYKAEHQKRVRKQAQKAKKSKSQRNGLHGEEDLARVGEEDDSVAVSIVFTFGGSSIIQRGDIIATRFERSGLICVYYLE